MSGKTTRSLLLIPISVVPVDDKKATGKARHKKSFFFVSRYRIRIGRFGIGWRSAAWSRNMHRQHFRFQREPVVVLRMFGLWVQWS